MFSTKIRVAFSVLVIRTLSASARARSASALALRTVARIVASATTTAISPPPNSMFSISLSVIALARFYILLSLFYAYLFQPRLYVEAGTGFGCHFVVSDDLHRRKALVEVFHIRR